MLKVSGTNCYVPQLCAYCPALLDFIPTWLRNKRTNYLCVRKTVLKRNMKEPSVPFKSSLETRDKEERRTWICSENALYWVANHIHYPIISSCFSASTGTDRSMRAILVSPALLGENIKQHPAAADSHPWPKEHICPSTWTHADPTIKSRVGPVGQGAPTMTLQSTDHLILRGRSYLELFTALKMSFLQLYLDWRFKSQVWTRARKIKRWERPSCEGYLQESFLIFLLVFKLKNLPIITGRSTTCSSRRVPNQARQCAATPLWNTALYHPAPSKYR